MTVNTSKSVNRVAEYFGGEDLEDRVSEVAGHMAGALLRMLQHRQKQRCETLVGELERIEQELAAMFNEEPASEATPEPSVNDSGANHTKPMTIAAADNNPVPVLLIDLLSFDVTLAWIL
ncbi:MAG: hypothetical protein JW818_01495 [Pirellulales bacterium]|nr:hypothetical protein [Pirellulales bacterium]